MMLQRTREREREKGLRLSFLFVIWLSLSFSYVLLYQTFPLILIFSQAGLKYFITPSSFHVISLNFLCFSPILSFTQYCNTQWKALHKSSNMWTPDLWIRVTFTFKHTQCRCSMLTLKGTLCSFCEHNQVYFRNCFRWATTCSSSVQWFLAAASPLWPIPL